MSSEQDQIPGQPVGADSMPKLQQPANVEGTIDQTVRRDAEPGGELVFETGAVIDGKYQVIRKIGQGGMGVVYLAMQKNIGRLCALKLIRNSLLESRSKEKIIARFRKEASFAASIRNPHIVDIYDLGEDKTWDFCYIAMEYVDGMTLRELLRTVKRLSEDEALVIISEIVEVLVAAYRQRIVHRDIKPDNIMLSKQGQVKLTDLGIARQTDKAGMTGTNHMVGTPAYAAPEQTIDASKVDSRADIYSLGATLFHLVTGELPFRGRTDRETIHMQRAKAVPNPRKYVPELSQETCDLIKKMMEKEPTNRFASPLELAEYLRMNCHLPVETDWHSVKLVLFNRSIISTGGQASTPSKSSAVSSFSSLGKYDIWHWRRSLPWICGVIFITLAILFIWPQKLPDILNPNYYAQQAETYTQQCDAWLENRLSDSDFRIEANFLLDKAKQLDYACGLFDEKVQRRNKLSASEEQRRYSFLLYRSDYVRLLFELLKRVSASPSGATDMQGKAAWRDLCSRILDYLEKHREKMIAEGRKPEISETDLDTVRNQLKENALVD